ncbi:MAG: DUF3318 domain-containing protein [Leptolyngbyaceae bacterium]|nr:DUF3318 domain-containing protein [Leptolyngbyaceae bacterium]
MISINFDLWSQLNKPQRDLTILRTVSWQGSVRWFKPDLYKGVGAVGLFGTVVELVQQDAMGILMAGGLTAIAVTNHPLPIALF